MDFQTIQRILQKDLGLEQVVLLFPEKDGLKDKRSSGPPTILHGNPLFQKVSKSPRPVTSFLRGQSEWCALWPVWTQGELVACYGLGLKLDGKHLTPEEEKLMDLLADRTALYLRDRQLWKLLETANRKSMLGLLSAAMLHEIRNPLTALSTLVQLFPQKKKDDSFLQSFEKVVPREIERLLEVTENLLDFSKPAAENKTTTVHLEDVIGHVTELLRPHFKTKKVELKIRQDKDLLLKGNSKQMEILLLNLLQNAFQSVGEGGKIEITARLSGKKQTKSGSLVRLEVKDNGRGISPEDRSKITEPFFSTRLEGMGLGLTICQEIIQNHKGYMKVKSSPTGGACFRVYFPSVSCK